MTEESVMSLGNEAIRTIVFVAGPMLIAALLMGVTVSVLQAVTQIHESTLTFIPKLVAVVLVFLVLAPWMLDVLETYMTHMMSNAGEWVR